MITVAMDGPLARRATIRVGDETFSYERPDGLHRWKLVIGPTALASAGALELAILDAFERGPHRAPASGVGARGPLVRESERGVERSREAD